MLLTEGVGEVVASSLQSLCFKYEETKVPGGLWLSDINQQESSLLLSSHNIISDPATPWTAARQASPSFTTSRSLLRLLSAGSVRPSGHLILCRPLLLLPLVLPSSRVCSNGSVHHIRWPEYWSCSFSISSSNEHPGLTSFRID